MDGVQVERLRARLRDTGWWTRALSLGEAVRSTRSPGGLLVVGPPEDEPWHLTAHLDDEARYGGFEMLRPTLVRWAPPVGAPPHLAVGLSRLESAGSGETVFLVAPGSTPGSTSEALLERLADARRIGATVVSVDGGDPELDDLVHERFTVGPSGLLAPDGSADGLELAQHLVSAASGASGARDLEASSGPRQSRSFPAIVGGFSRLSRRGQMTS
jgi:hypothetical protein